MGKRVGVFGWGVVAPDASNIERFEQRLKQGDTWLKPFDGFGPSHFKVGIPDFDFSDYKGWISDRFPPSRFGSLKKKMGLPTQYAIGCFVQALAQNPGVEAKLQELGSQAHVYIGAGLTDFPTYHQESLNLYHSQRRWNRFWSQAQTNSAFERYLSDPATARAENQAIPADPSQVDVNDRDQAEDVWWKYWTFQSPQLQDYLEEVREIECWSVEGEVESGKAALIRKKRGAIRALQEKWNSPEPPWNEVTANTLWNIGNAPSSQISMMGKITGMTFGPFAACSTFGYALKLGMDAIDRGEAKMVVMGSSDPPPHGLSVAAFYNARVVAADGEVSKPLTGMRGTHVAGGACLWIIADLEYGLAQGWQPLGLEPIAVGVSADADHLITPSAEGPTVAIESAIKKAGINAEDIKHWDLHATATPGDFLEVKTAHEVIGDGAYMTARKGSFGHGMGSGGGFELTAQYLGYRCGTIMPTALKQDEFNAEIAQVHQRVVFSTSKIEAVGIAGKLSMGVGGINACIISRKFPDAITEKR